jgi:hypothetical protein
VAKTHLGKRLADRPLFSWEFIDNIPKRNHKFADFFTNLSVDTASVEAISGLLYQWIDLLEMEEDSTRKLIVGLTSDVAAMDVTMYLDYTKRHSSCLGIVCDKEIEEKTISLCRLLGRPVTREELFGVHTEVATRYGKLDVFQANTFDTRAIWRTIQRANDPRAMINSIERFHKRTAAQVEDFLSGELNRRDWSLKNYANKPPAVEVNSFNNHSLYFFDFVDYIFQFSGPAAETQWLPRHWDAESAAAAAAAAASAQQAAEEEEAWCIAVEEGIEMDKLIAAALNDILVRQATEIEGDHSTSVKAAAR